MLISYALRTCFNYLILTIFIQISIIHCFYRPEYLLISSTGLLSIFCSKIFKFLIQFFIFSILQCSMLILNFLIDSLTCVFHFVQHVLFYFQTILLFFLFIYFYYGKFRSYISNILHKIPHTSLLLFCSVHNIFYY